MFYGRDLFADQEEWFVETVRAAAANDAVNWVVKLHPGERLEAQARPRQRRARRARRDSRARRRAAAARQAARARHRHLTWSLFDVDGLGRDDPRLDRLRAAVLRHARADRGDRLLLGPRLHRRLRHRARSISSGSRGSTTFRRPTPRASSSREATRTRSSGCARRGSRASAPSTCRSSRSTTRSRRRSSVSCAHAGRARARGGPTTARAVGRRAHASSTTSSCRSFVSMRGSSSSGSSAVARRGSVVSAAAQPSSRSSRSVVSLRLPYG